MSGSSFVSADLWSIKPLKKKSGILWLSHFTIVWIIQKSPRKDVAEIYVKSTPKLSYSKSRYRKEYWKKKNENQ